MYLLVLTWYNAPVLCVDCSRLACCSHTQVSRAQEGVVENTSSISWTERYVGLLCVYVRTCVHVTTYSSYVLSVELSQLH